LKSRIISKVFIIKCVAGKGKGKGTVTPLQARLWPRGWVEL